ncbi:adenylate/guanylate cyclase domain-containing protein [Cyclobacterium marinum]|uniref:adenylate/guanylate cyclase domain-containing protein n=1 Tax=Cyclobacterium marinum TaxID=104 RepID=UPI001659F8F5|nr:adenylate/guanylate cyclase domain-containing protein [Cyclobacterium marinum]MBI0400748.1 adenylate/guanylate cyclase domain-containing protein [Cyclobacterium marinum]
MLSREIVRNFKIYFIVGFIFTTFSAYSRLILSEMYGIEVLGHPSVSFHVKMRFALLIIFLGSFGLALLSSIFDILIIKRLLTNNSLKIALIIGIPTQAIMIVLIVQFINFLYEHAILYVFGEPAIPLDVAEIVFGVIHLIMAVSLSKLLIAIDRKLGPGNLWKMLSGRFFKPREEERIFMFVDLKNSTPIAEKIGHLEYSRLLQDCFQDFSIVDRYRADIYQYVGDEVVVSWTLKKGLKNDNFLKAFFAFTDLLNKKSNYYQKKYGIDPFFKAGANVGPVIISEVGDIKKEITYHGDTLNTAARIQEKCNDLSAQLLISEPLYRLIEKKEAYQIDDVGSIHLKGKKKYVRLYRVAQINQD